MLTLKLLPVFALLFVMITACGEKDEKNNESPAVRPEIPLNAPAELLGVWKACNATSDAASSTAIYNFKADGALEYTTETFSSGDCTGSSTSSVVFKGSYVAGSGNALDIIFPIDDPKDNKSYTIYRVFSVQGETLLISNNVGAGADAEHRDYDLNSKALKLTKTPPVLD